MLFIVIGVILIRHLHLTRAIIGLIIGITWIVQGLTALIGGISGGVREGRGWWIAFGAVSLVAGIVVTVTPASSLNALAVLLGIWFIIMGIFEIIGGFMLRRAGTPRAADRTLARTRMSRVSTQCRARLFSLVRLLTGLSPRPGDASGLPRGMVAC